MDDGPGHDVLLDVRGITVRFGGNVALDEVRLEVAGGRVTGLIGPNGAGKTTLFNAITGLLTPSAGSMTLSGRDLGRLPPYKRARLGLARTFQRLELFTLLSVRENVLVAADLRARFGHDGVDPRKDVDRIIERVGLGGLADERVDALPTGQARLVEIARALATNPRVLLLDEPASGLDDEETDDLGRLLRELAGEGMAVLLVEHDVPLVMAVCDRIYVLDFGAVIAEGDPESIRTNPKVLAAYLGDSAGGAAR
ncbi:MAG: ABC transporter ATP-binding protein [Acidimicrobiia bacterium]